MGTAVQVRAGKVVSYTGPVHRGVSPELVRAIGASSEVGGQATYAGRSYARLASLMHASPFAEDSTSPASEAVLLKETVRLAAAEVEPLSEHVAPAV